MSLYNNRLTATNQQQNKFNWIFEPNKNRKKSESIDPKKEKKMRMEWAAASIGRYNNDDKFDFVFFLILFGLIWNTYKRFDSMWAAVETLDSYDCIESHRQYREHLRVAISMNWKLKHSFEIHLNKHLRSTKF